MPKVDTRKCRVKFCPYAPTSRDDLDAHVDRDHRRSSDHKLVCCHCPTYATDQMSNLNSHMSSRHDTARERLVCPVEGCGSTQASQRHLDAHIEKKHNQTGYMPCPVQDCAYKTQYPNALESHVASVHSTARPFACPFEACDFAAKRKDTLQTHMRLHTGERPYLCTAEGCEKTFKFRQSLTQHKEHHQPVKPWIECTMCTRYRTKRASRLREHVNEVHLNIKRFSCPYDSCDFTTARGAAVRQHVNAIHEHRDVHSCPIETCDFVTLWPVSLQHHMRFNHTDTGARVRNGQEHHFLRALGEHFHVVQPYAIRRELLTHCGRKFIHVDAAIALPARELLVLIECDEQQHKDGSLYSVEDELSRMQDATLGIRASGENAHILWIRFNPDTYTVVEAGAGKEIRKNDAMDERVARLIEFIGEFMPADNDTDEDMDMSIAYMYYDMVNGTAAVTQHAAFYAELRACTVTVTVTA